MPAAGSTASPSENSLKTKAKRRLDVSSEGSRKMPPRNGRKNASTRSLEKPSRRSASAVVTCGAVRISLMEPRERRRRSRATRSLSGTLPGASRRLSNARTGWRKGSAMREKRPSLRMSAPLSNGRSPRRSKSSTRRASGYAVSSTWNPRSSRKPSTASVRTRPPGASPRSSTSTSSPAACSSRAQQSPETPAPTTMTSGIGAVSTGVRLGRRAPPLGVRAGGARHQLVPVRGELQQVGVAQLVEEQPADAGEVRRPRLLQARLARTR